MLECVANISEGRDARTLGAFAEAAGADLLDVHVDADHNRSVFTMIGEAAPRRLTEVAFAELDIADHSGAHPRLGIVDVVPFIAIGDTATASAVAARDRFADWMTTNWAVPCFLYGDERTLPEIRRSAFTDLAPDVGPERPHPRYGACCVGQRPAMVAYNVWLQRPDLVEARAVAAALRGPDVRALGLRVGNAVQVSMNLVYPTSTGPAQVFDQVAASVTVDRAELVGLVPDDVLQSTDPGRWGELDLSTDRTIEARIAARADPSSH